MIKVWDLSCMMPATDDWKKALQILKDHYDVISKPRVISLNNRAYLAHKEWKWNRYGLCNMYWTKAQRNSKWQTGHCHDTEEPSSKLQTLLYPYLLRNWWGDHFPTVPRHNYDHVIRRKNQSTISRDWQPGTNENIIKVRDTVTMKKCFSCGQQRHFAQDFDWNQQNKLPWQEDGVPSTIVQHTATKLVAPKARLLSKEDIDISIDWCRRGAYL